MGYLNREKARYLEEPFKDAFHSTSTAVGSPGFQFEFTGVPVAIMESSLLLSSEHLSQRISFGCASNLSSSRVEKVSFIETVPSSEHSITDSSIFLINYLSKHGQL